MLKQTDLSRVDLNLLVLFETVMQERHVGRSAERLRLSPSAVSHGLRRLRALLADPLFLKVPRGVMPTDRAVQIDPLIRSILAQVRQVVSTSEPFNPGISTRRFVIAAPDGVSSVFLPALLERLAETAPSINISLRQLLPRKDEPSPELAWRDVYAALEAREMDIAVVPNDDFPMRFATRRLYEERFVIAMGRSHPDRHRMGPETYCRAKHLVVSRSGDPSGFVDSVLSDAGLSRRVALTVPNFMSALAVLAGSEFVSALPERFIAMHGDRFGVVGVEPPIPLPGFRLNLVVLRAALEDAGMAWMMDQFDHRSARA